ncbi:hypothetical protein SCP_1201610 [Sparassis crispa]|uniref:Uncharacterized protein n=1 Tax=Sparassis crispa TaxID=139825 RepID=A0A401H0I0_9APHY|nr:hypothetical protein SCP_1201610 [Sparassis crispa]GBE87935.1 hypothetical protein SCP_1201610 [Sparassis crispa]
MSPKREPERKPELVPPSGFQEPSDPSRVAPEDRPESVRGVGAKEEPENPQLIAHERGEQATDRREGIERKGERGKARL